MTVSRIDHDWIREYVGWPITGREKITLRSLSHSDGLMATVHQVRCAGHSFVFKGPPDNLGEWGSLVADTGLMAREVQSYRFLHATGLAGKVAPACYWSALADDGRDALALQDLGDPGALNTVMARGLNLAQAAAAVRSLALVHATLASVGTSEVPAPYPWLYTASSEGLMRWLRMGLEELPQVVSSRWPDSSSVAQDVAATVDIESLLARAHNDATCAALCHGDAWTGNILFPPQPAAPARQTAFLIDWQFAMWGNPMSDVALLLLSSVDPTAQELWREELLSEYHTTFTTSCELDYPVANMHADFHRAEPFASLVAIATLEDYTIGMGSNELAQFAPRVVAAMDQLMLTADGRAIC